MSAGTHVRKVVPYLLLPLAMIACGLASSPWLRAFPYGIIGVSLFGAALLSVLVPVVVVGIGVRRLWLTMLIDVAIFVFYELLVTLRSPGGFDQLYNGLVHGPSQLLTFALPLVSPRTLLVVPVALCWLSGALLGETIARGWHTVLPYLGVVVVFGLSYAATARAITSTSDGHRYDTLLAAALLFTLLLLRAAQTWIEQDESAASTQPDGVLPLRGLWIGAALAVVIAVIAAGIAQASVFRGPPAAPDRRPPIADSRPLTPLSFVAGLRPSDPTSRGRTMFTVATDRAGPNYVPIATVDTYDGDGWSLAPGRTFRPTGGVIPADTDPTLRPRGGVVTQQYTIHAGPLTSAPWMPFMQRPTQVTGISVDIDPSTGMIVPDSRLRSGDSYAVRSAVSPTPLTTLRNAGVGSYAQTDQQRPANITTALANLVTSLHTETQTTTATPVITFLQAVAHQFQTRDTLAGGKAAAAAASASASDSPTAPSTPRATGKRGGKKGTTPKGRAASSGTVAAPSPGNPAQRTGGTSFADVLASIRQFHSATPEQFATLMCLIARQAGVPARVVAGFRLPLPSGDRELPAGFYTVTGSEAWTWVEVPIAGHGWVVIDPSPSTYAREQQSASASAPPSTTPSVSSTPNARITPANSGHAPAKRSAVPHQSHVTAVSVVTVAIIVAAVLALALLLFLLLRKTLRARRRRRVADPRRRLLGAWQESLDLLEENGLPDLTGYTGREVGAATRDRFGPEAAAAVHTLGVVANVALFSPSVDVPAHVADEAWRTQAQLAAALRHARTRRERLNARLRYHRPGPWRPAPGPASWSQTSAAMSAAGVAAARDHATGRRSVGTHR